jgi:hypothetical protein
VLTQSRALLTVHNRLRASTLGLVYFAEEPWNWPDQPSLSTLEALLIFAGIPLLVIGVVSLLVMAPSLAKGPRYRPTEDWAAGSEWFGAPAEAEDPDAAGRRQLEQRGEPSETGGASARW